MLMKYFGFEEDPFGTAPNPRSIYQSKTHTEALGSLRYAYMSNRGISLLIAGAGMGKTTLLKCFLEKIRQSDRNALLVDIDPSYEPGDMISSILCELGATPSSSRVETPAQLREILIASARLQRKLVLVVDDAQNLSSATLDAINLLADIASPNPGALHVILAGQPQLSKRLMQPSYGTCRKRIATICRIGSFSEVETRAYIEHRLTTSGCRRDALFAPNALTMIAEASQGIPLTINSLCFSALTLCCTLQCQQVDVNIVAEVIANLQLPIDLEPIFNRAAQFAGSQYLPCETNTDTGVLYEEIDGWNPPDRTQRDGNSLSQTTCNLPSHGRGEVKPSAHRITGPHHDSNGRGNAMLSPASIVRLTLTFAAFLSAFVIGSIGCPLILQHFPRLSTAITTRVEPAIPLGEASTAQDADKGTARHKESRSSATRSSAIQGMRGLNTK